MGMHDQNPREWKPSTVAAVLICGAVGVFYLLSTGAWQHFLPESWVETIVESYDLKP